MRAAWRSRSTQRPHAEHPDAGHGAVGRPVVRAACRIRQVPAAADGHRFALFPDRKPPWRRPTAMPQRVRMVFDQSVRGMAVDAPVDFLGIEIGNGQGRSGSITTPSASASRWRSIADLPDPPGRRARALHEPGSDDAKRDVAAAAAPGRQRPARRGPHRQPAHRPDVHRARLPPGPPRHARHPQRSRPSPPCRARSPTCSRSWPRSWPRSTRCRSTTSAATSTSTLKQARTAIEQLKPDARLRSPR
jgi:hypothetical protein